MTQPTITAPSTPNDEIEFRFKEYDALREEVMGRLKELWSLEKFALGGAAAIAAWLLTHINEVGSNRVAWWLPFFFLFICAARFAAGMYHLGFRVSEYLIKTEEKFLGLPGGWEKRFRKLKPNETTAYALVWIFALGLSLVLPFMKVGCA